MSRTVDTDVLLVLEAQLLERLDDHGEASGLAHGLRAEDKAGEEEEALHKGRLEEDSVGEWDGRRRGTDL